MNRSAPSALPLLVLALALVGCQSPGDPTAPAAPLPSNASVTVFPVLLAGRPHADAANVVGILLERGGLQQVELAAATFTPDANQDFAAQNAAFGAFVAQHGVPTDYALLASYHGSPRGVTEVRGTLVDKQGRLVCCERLVPGDVAFDRSKPGDPMDCSVLLVQQLRGPLRLDDPTRAGAPEGKLAARMKQKSGVPPEAEFTAMRERLAAWKQAGRPSVLVYPPRVGDEFPAEAARTLAAAIEKTGAARATAVAAPLPFAATPSSNEQQVLWSAARSIQQAVRQAPPLADYVLCADFLMARDQPAGAVHTFVLTPAGEFVIVDFQNSHHADFQRLPPTSLAACCELVALRLANSLR